MNLLIMVGCLLFLVGCNSIPSECLPSTKYSVQKHGEQIYPSAAYRDGIEGEVIVRFDIHASGSVENAQVLSDSSQGVFGKYAIYRVQTTRFNPAIENCKAIPTRGVELKVDFNLSPNRPGLERQ